MGGFFSTVENGGGKRPDFTAASGAWPWRTGCHLTAAQWLTSASSVVSAVSIQTATHADNADAQSQVRGAPRLHLPSRFRFRGCLLTQSVNPFSSQLS